MAYLQPFAFDVFVSYAHADNIPYVGLNGSQIAWPLAFFERFSRVVRQRLGGNNDLAIFFDKDLRANQQLEEMEAAAQGAAIFLAIGSRSYVQRDWTLRELSAFWNSADVPGHSKSSRAFVAECVPLLPGTSYPKPINSHHRHRLYTEESTSMLDPRSSEFIAAIDRLAEQMALKLLDMRSSPMLNPGTAAHSIDASLALPERTSHASAIEAPDNSPTGIEEFVRGLQEGHDAILSKPIEAVSESITALPPRVPKFLLFKLPDGNVAMAICDQDHTVDVTMLRKSNQPQRDRRKVSKLSPSDLEKLGFSSGQVHPMFNDPEGRIHQIYLDANVYVHALYFPRSIVTLPFYHEGAQAKKDIEIGAFLHALNKVHSGRLVIANIVAGRWQDEALQQGISQLSVHTRFAPTPSGSLHIGNVRSGMIPYLFYRSGIANNNFLLRFDDTDHTAGRDDAVELIKSQLRWLGFSVPSRGTEDKVFRQSSHSQQDIYSLVFTMLRRCGLVRKVNGDDWLNWEHPAAQFGCWFDVSNGPRIIHYSPEARDERTGVIEKQTGLASLSLRSTPRGVRSNSKRFDYKFCGAVDDLLWSSFVVRDVGQRRTFTPRQALIRNAIEFAWQRSGDDDGHLSKDQARILSHCKVLRGSAPRPLPLFASPIYYHAPIVVERVLQPATDKTAEQWTVRKISKRHQMKGGEVKESDPAFFLDPIMAHSRLPETIISYILATIVPPAKSVSMTEHRLQLARLCGQLGAEATMDIIATQASLSWLRKRRPQILASTVDIENQERMVLKSLTNYHFARRMDEIKELQPRSEEVVDRLFFHLGSLGSWREAVAIATHPRGDAQWEDRAVKALFAAYEHICSRPKAGPEPDPELASDPNRGPKFLSALRTHLPSEFCEDFARCCALLRHVLTGLDYSPLVDGESMKCPGPSLLVLTQILYPEFIAHSESRR